MLSISKNALELIWARSEALHLELPPVAGGGCCLPAIQECPAVRFGPPPDAERHAYFEQVLDGVRVHVPRRMRTDLDLVITVSSFLGFRRVIVEGWKLL
jgi:hypothetical protein